MMDGDEMPKFEDQINVDALFAEQRERSQIWDVPQFVVRDVCAITGATAKALEHFLTPARNMVRLHGNWVNPGTGKRRIFTGGQVLMIKSAYVMNKIGFPQRFSATLAETIERRAKNRLAGLSPETGMTIISYPLRDKDDWALKVIYDATQELPVLPLAFHMLNADGLIDQVQKQLTAIINGEEIPDFSIPDPTDDVSPYAPASNFFREWDKDAEDRWVYVGLNHEETQELLHLEGLKLEGDNLISGTPVPDKDPNNTDRYLELVNRRESVRLDRCDQELREKLRNAKSPP